MPSGVAAVAGKGVADGASMEALLMGRLFPSQIMASERVNEGGPRRPIRGPAEAATVKALGAAADGSRNAHKRPTRSHSA